MKNLSGRHKTKIANFLGGILFVALGTSFTPEILTKGNDTVAYERALCELEMHLRKDSVLDTNIEEQLKIFDIFSAGNKLNGKVLLKAESKELHAKPKGNIKISAPIEGEKGWYFMFDK